MHGGREFLALQRHGVVDVYVLEVVGNVLEESESTDVSMYLRIESEMI